MEKVLLEVLVNDIPADCIITLSESAIKDENGERIWHDKEKNIVAAKKYPLRIEVYVRETSGQYRKVDIRPSAIKSIYEEIIRIENTDCTVELDY